MEGVPGKLFGHMAYYFGWRGVLKKKIFDYIYLLGGEAPQPPRPPLK